MFRRRHATRLALAPPAIGWFAVETLEPRLLLSADPVSAHLGDVASLLPGAPDPDQASADALGELTARQPRDGNAADDTGSLDPDVVPGSDAKADARRELIFVDAGVEDAQRLIADLLAGAAEREVAVFTLSADRDGIAQMSEVLAGYTDLDAVHVLSHGSDGAVRLADGVLDRDSLARYADALRGWSEALDAEADLMFYGCNLAAGADGRALVGEIAALTGADVAASEDLTGSAASGGDWDLEYRAGMVETDGALSIAGQNGFAGTLAIINVTTTADLSDGGDTSSISDLLLTPGSDGISLREAVIAANATPGDDVIVLGAGTHELTLAGTGEDAAASGDLDITSNITITGAGMSSTVIDGNSLDRVFHVTDSASHVVVFEGLTITGGSVASDGGGVLIEAAPPNVPEVTFDNVRVTGNEVTGNNQGGGIYSEGALLVTESRVDGNTADNVGGGIRITGGGSAIAVIQGSLIDGNVSGASGGGIVHNGASLSILNSTLSGNTGSIGGGIFAGADFTLEHVTIAENRSTTGGAGIDTAGSAQATLRNTILSNNLHLDLAPANADQTQFSLGNNIDTDATAGLAGSGDQSGTVGAPLDVMLGALADNGGPTLTHALLAGSIAIDNGASAQALDQRGLARDGNPDVGAFELGATVSDGFREALWLSTVGDVSGSGTDGLTDWDRDTLLEVGAPAFSLEPGTTSGAVSRVLDLTGDFGADGGTELTGLHLVGTSLVVGGSITLEPGDVLFSVNGAQPTLTSSNSVTIDKSDVVRFRPDAAGDYSAGTFEIVLDNPLGTEEIGGISLVEQDLSIAGHPLSAGDFLLVETKGADHLVQHFAVSGAGAGATSGTASVLVDGNDIAIGSADFTSVHLVGSDVSVGGASLSAGTVLVSLDKTVSGPPGFAGLASVGENDVVALSVTGTGTGATAGTGSLLFEGADARFDSGNEGIDALSLVPIASPPSGTAPVSVGDAYDVLPDTPLAVPVGSGVLANDSDPQGDPLTAEVTQGPANGVLSVDPLALGTLTNLTGSADIEGQPAWSPDGSKIAFFSDASGDRQIYVMNADGSAVTQLTSGAGVRNHQPSWSPDGTQLAITSFAYGDDEILIIDAATGAEDLRLTNRTSIDHTAAWSPDGTQIAFSSDRNGGDLEIWVANADGSGAPARLTTAAGVDRSPEWSPDGSQIVFRSTRDGDANIYVMNADGTSQTRLTSDPGADVQPAWAPDGSMIAFSSDRDGSRDVFVMNADGSNQRSLGTTPGMSEIDLSWSPDGTRLAVEADGDVQVGALRFDGSFTYTPDTSFSGSDGFRYVASDGSEDSAAATVTMSVNAPPTLTGFATPAATTPEDVALEVTFAGLAAQGDEADADGSVTAFVVETVGFGDLRIGADAGSATPFAAGSNDVIGAGLNAYWTPPADVNGTLDAFKAYARDDDGVLSSIAATVQVAVTAVNDEPSLTLAGDQNVVEDSGPHTVAGFATPAAGGGTDESGQTFSYAVTGNTNAALFAAGPAIDANGQLTYTLNTQVSGTATITVEMQDSGGTGNGGDDTSAAVSFDIVVDPVNDAPLATITPPGASYTALENSTLDLHANGLAVSDVDAGAGTIQVQLSVGEGVLTVDAGGNTVTVAGSGNDTVNLLGTLAEITKLLDGLNGASIGYDAVDAPSPATTLTLLVNDQNNSGSGGVLAASDTATIDITAQNDAPSLDPSGDMRLGDVLEDSVNPIGNSVAEIVASAGGDRITDPDAGAVEGVAVIGVNDADGTWEYSTDDGASWIAFTAGGVADGATDDTSAVLLGDADRIRFVPDAGYTGTAGTLTFRAWDQSSGAPGDVGVDASATGVGTAFSVGTETATLDVDPAGVVENSVPGAQSVDEDGALVFSTATGNAVSVSDGLPGDGLIRVTLTVSDGTLTLATTAGLGFESGADGTAAMTVVGLESAVNAALDGAVYAPDGDFNGSGGLQVATDRFVDLVARYTFDTPGNRGNDDSPGGTNDGTIIGANPVTDGTRGEVLDFDGSNDEMRIGGLLGQSQTLTLSAFVRMDPFRSQDEIISLGDSVVIRADAAFGAGVQGFFHDGTTWRETNSGQDIAGTGWHHLAYSVDGLAGEQVLYIDGVEAARTGFSGAIDYSLGPDTYLGAHGTLFASYFGGRMDDVRIYDKVLTAREVAAVSTERETDTDTVDIIVNPVNDAPSFTVAGDQTVDEDSGPHAIANFATASAGGGTDESGQTFTYTVTGNTNAALFAAGPAIDANGELTYTLNPDVNGSATITVQMRDSGGTANGGDDTAATVDFDITVNPVNDAPTATITPVSFGVDEDDGPRLLGGVSIGDGDAGGAPLDVTLSVGDGVLTLGSTAGLGFSAGANGSASMTVTGTGAALNAALATLTYQPDPDFNGSDNLMLLVDDRGNTGSGGAQSASDSAPIVVTPVNDAPSFTLLGDQTVAEDSGPHTVAGFATPSAGGGTDESGQTFTYTVAGNTNAALFAAGPAIDANGELTYTLNPGVNGSATITVQLRDSGGTANGGIDNSTAVDFDITVDPVNSAPVVDVATAAYATAENTALPLHGTGLSVADLDAGASAVQATLSVGEGRLVVLPGASGVSVSGSGTASVVLLGPVTAINTLLDGLAGASVSYVAADAPAASTALTLTVDDLGNSGLGGALSDSDGGVISVSADNDAPGADAGPADRTVPAAGAFALQGTGMSIADVDAGGLPVQATLSVGEGALAVSAGSTGVTVSGSGTANVVLGGTVTAINNLLAGNGGGLVSYTPGAAPALFTAFTLTVDDLGNTGAGGALSASDVSLLSIAPAPDPDPTPEVAVASDPDPAPEPDPDPAPEPDPDPAPEPDPDPAPDPDPGDEPEPDEEPATIVDEEAPDEVTSDATGPAASAVEPSVVSTDVASVLAPTLGGGEAGGTDRDPLVGRAESIGGGLELLRELILQRAPDELLVLDDANVRPLPTSLTTTLLEELDRVRDETSQRGDTEELLVASTTTLASGLSVGYVVWLVRGGVLLSSVLSSLPAWRLVDPLPVLGRMDDEDDEDLLAGEDEGLDEMLDDAAERVLEER